MMDELTGLGLLANVLALPNTIPQQARAMNERRAMVAGISGLAPETVDQYAPAPTLTEFPGAHVPVLGSILRGAGTVGQLMQTVLGSGPGYGGGLGGGRGAMGPSLSDLRTIAALQQHAKTQQYFTDHPDALKNPQARTALAAGMDAKDAFRLETSGGHDTLARWLQENPGKSLEEGISAVAQLQAKAKWEGRRAAGVPMPGSASGGGEGGDDLGGKSPSFEKDLHAMAHRKFPGDPDKQFAWMENERGHQGAVKTEANTAPLADRTKLIADAKPPKLSAATQSMVETAPKVTKLAARVREDLKSVATGPLASRYNEAMTGTVGEDDPAWARYRTDVGLLTTALMRMHVGARGGEGIMEHFQNLIGAGHQSAANMEAALQSIEDYATDVAHTQPIGAKPAAGGGSPRLTTDHDPTDEDKAFLRQHASDLHSLIGTKLPSGATLTGVE